MKSLKDVSFGWVIRTSFDPCFRTTSEVVSLLVLVHPVRMQAMAWMNAAIDGFILMPVFVIVSPSSMCRA